MNTGSMQCTLHTGTSWRGQSYLGRWARTRGMYVNAALRVAEASKASEARKLVSCRKQQDDLKLSVKGQIVHWRGW